MSVDKFGRHYNSILQDKIKKVKEHEFKFTAEGNYDVQTKLIRNLGGPIAPSDAVTKGYVDSKYPKQNVLNPDSVMFEQKRLSGVGDAVYYDEAVNVQTLKRMSISLDTTGKTYDARYKRIKCISNAIEKGDAANLENVESLCKDIAISMGEQLNKNSASITRRLIDVENKIATERQFIKKVVRSLGDKLVQNQKRVPKDVNSPSLDINWDEIFSETI